MGELAAEEARKAQYQTKEPTEAEKRKEEEILENKLAYQLQASETADEKRRRENAQIEAADNALTNEMFDSSDSQKKSDGNSIASSVAGAVLKKNKITSILLSSSQTNCRSQRRLIPQHFIKNLPKR